MYLNYAVTASNDAYYAALPRISIMQSLPDWVWE